MILGKMMPAHITFTHLNIERYSHLRADLHNIPLEKKRYILFCSGKPVFQVDTRSSSLTPKIYEHEDIPINKESIFLGKKGEHYLFTIELPQIPNLSDERIIKAIDLRKAASQTCKEDAALLGLAQSLLYWNKNCIYCHRCAQRLISTEAGDRRTCLKCNIEVYPRINPVVIMLIHTPNKEHVLLGRQKHYPKGMYSCLAGFIETGETLHDAVCREVFEETGIIIERNSIAFVDHQPWPFPSQMMLGFIAQANSEQIILDDELEDARWFSISDLENMRTSQHKKGYTIPNSVAIATSLIDIFLSQTSPK